MRELFLGLTGWNFAKLEVKVVKLSRPDKFVLQFRKVAPFLHRRAAAENWVKICYFAPKI